jgi:hypothetical protein
MDDFDPVLLIVLAVVAVMVLKPDLLSGLFGGRRSSAPPVEAPAPYPTLLQPPAAQQPRTQLAPWRTYIPESPHQVEQNALDREHGCPPGQAYNTISNQCQTINVRCGSPTGACDLEGRPLPAWVGVPPAQTPPDPPRSQGSPPETVHAIKASQRRSALFTPWSNN